tara:strand:- start:2281 stop:2880 length:600 start_codon:yes stop_codon:yes gene_type:complete
MSDLMAANQSGENGDMIKRLTAIAESQNEIIKNQARIIRSLRRDVQDLKSKSDVHTSQIAAIADLTGNVLELTKSSDLHYKMIVMGQGAIPHSVVAGYLGMKNESVIDMCKGSDPLPHHRRGRDYMIHTHGLKQSALEQMVEDGWDILGVGNRSGKKIPQHKRKEYFRGVVEFNSHGYFIGKKHEDYVKILTDRYNKNR